jgi:hypothetical protein
MTDALAQWCLVEQERGKNPWEELEGVLADPSCRGGFVEWIEGLRSARGFRNDDVTLLAIRLKEQSNVVGNPD